MKKCPNCQKTFDDNMKFCQSDGTPLVVVADNKPEVDPYATMVANQGDLQIPPEEPKKEEPKKEEPKPEPEPDPYATMVASSPPLPKEEPKKEEDILEVPGDDGADEVDPMKTMVIRGNTSDNIKVDVPKEEKSPSPTPPPVNQTPKVESEEEIPSEAKTMISAEIPKFDAPPAAPPVSGDAGQKPEPPKDPTEPPKQQVPKTESPKQAPPQPAQPKQAPPQAMPPQAPPSSPFDKPKAESKPIAREPKESKPAPIPSPFDDSMPPGYAPPSTPPFEPPKEPLKPEPLNNPKKDEIPKSPFADPQKPVVKSDTDGWGQKQSAAVVKSDNQAVAQTPPSSSGEAGEVDQTLAYVALGSGIASMTICCFLGIILGPLGLILGMKARGNAAENPNEYGGEKLALIGMITGGIGTLIGLALIVWQVVVMFLFN
jgi:hypothetical protein